MSPEWAEITDCAEALMQSSAKMDTMTSQRSMPIHIMYVIRFHSPQRS